MWDIDSAAGADGDLAAAGAAPCTRGAAHSSAMTRERSVATAVRRTMVRIGAFLGAMRGAREGRRRWRADYARVDTGVNAACMENLLEWRDGARRAGVHVCMTAAFSG